MAKTTTLIDSQLIADPSISYAINDTMLTKEYVSTISNPIDKIMDKLKEIDDHLHYLESRQNSFESEFMNFLYTGYFRGQPFVPMSKVNPPQPYQPNPNTLNQPMGYPTFADLDKIKDSIKEVQQQVSRLTNEFENYIEN